MWKVLDGTKSFLIAMKLVCVSSGFGFFVVVLFLARWTRSTEKAPKVRAGDITICTWFLFANVTSKSWALWSRTVTYTCMAKQFHPKCTYWRHSFSTYEPFSLVDQLTTFIALLLYCYLSAARFMNHTGFIFCLSNIHADVP